MGEAAARGAGDGAGDGVLDADHLVRSTESARAFSLCSRPEPEPDLDVEDLEDWCEWAGGGSGAFIRALAAVIKSIPLSVGAPDDDDPRLSAFCRTDFL
jgi:hypothetical protein